jgi:hypothetical protein
MEFCEGEHNFYNFSYRNEGYLFLCWNCPKSKIEKSDDFEERTFPITFVSQRNDRDCGVAAFAMLKRIDYDSAFELCKEYLDDGDFTIRNAEMMRAFLESQGFEAMFCAWDGKFSVSLNKLCDEGEQLLVITTPPEGEGHYFVFYDGLIYCSKTGITKEDAYFAHYKDEEIIGIILIRELALIEYRKIL